MSELKMCNDCTLEECDFRYNGKDFVCQRGYILTAEDKHRMMREAIAEAKRNGEILNE